MLVLTRKCQEVVVVGGSDGFEPMLKITVLGIVNGKVRLGFEAAADVPVHRMEVWERIRAGVPADSPIGIPTVTIGRPINRDPVSIRNDENEVRMQLLEPEYRDALQGCLEGRFTEERVLYQTPIREQVPWDLFPNSARPSDPVEGGHEGGAI